MEERRMDNWEDELDAIRIQLYEETKHMTPEEHAAYFNAQAIPVMKQYNMKWASLRPVEPTKRKRLPPCFHIPGMQYAEEEN